MERQLLYHIDPSLQYRPDVNPQQYRKYTINAVRYCCGCNHLSSCYIHHSEILIRFIRMNVSLVRYCLPQDDPVQKRVFKTYLKMHTYQTYDYVAKKQEEYSRFNKVLF